MSDDRYYDALQAIVDCDPDSRGARIARLALDLLPEECGARYESTFNGWNRSTYLGARAALRSHFTAEQVLKFFVCLRDNQYVVRGNGELG